MKEKSVKRIVSTIPMVITILCLLAAFATHNWDYRLHPDVREPTGDD